MSKKTLLIIAVAIIVSIVVSCLYFDRIALFTLSKFYKLDISYRSLNKDSTGTYVFEEMRLMNRKMGVGFYARKASIKPIWKANFLQSINFEFKLKDLHFIKKPDSRRHCEDCEAKPKQDEAISQSMPPEKYDSLDQIVSMPFEDRWTYKELSGNVELFSNGLTLKNFSAEGREIRLLISGDIFYNNVIDAEITIHFARDVLKDIPPELTSVIMKDEPAEWKSFSLKAKGDMSSPSLHITGSLFRLNIGTLEMK